MIKCRIIIPIYILVTYLQWKTGLDTSFEGRIISLGINCRLVAGRIKGTTKGVPSDRTARMAGLSMVRPCLMFKTKGSSK